MPFSVKSLISSPDIFRDRGRFWAWNCNFCWYKMLACARDIHQTSLSLRDVPSAMTQKSSTWFWWIMMIIWMIRWFVTGDYNDNDHQVIMIMILIITVRMISMMMVVTVKMMNVIGIITVKMMVIIMMVIIKRWLWLWWLLVLSKSSKVISIISWPMPHPSFFVPFIIPFARETNHDRTRNFLLINESSSSVP